MLRRFALFALLTAQEVSATMDISAGFDLLLVRNSTVPVTGPIHPMAHR
jgi:hypothetical protein